MTLGSRSSSSDVKCQVPFKVASIDGFVHFSLICFILFIVWKC